MPDNQRATHEHYRLCMRLFAQMIGDLSQCDRYVQYLIDGKGLDEFETALRTKIEKTPK